MRHKYEFSSKAKKFELPGSTVHYPQILSFTIEHMLLKIKPDFDTNTLKNCEQTLKIRAFEDINEIRLDVAEIVVHEILSSYNIPIISFNVLNKDDKLIINLGKTLAKDDTIDLTIRFSAGFYRIDQVEGIHKPRSGFHFISSGRYSQSVQAWTQGQALESKYWFPCLDDPQVKFPREIQVSVPNNDLIVISNGVLAEKEGDTWTWKEPNPTPAYLTSVVIGRFVQETQEYHSSNDMSDQDNIISLSYYWPRDIPKENAMLTFAYTPNMMRFFEEFFGIKYPYKKYAQVAVEQFEFAGMENTNCTTLTRSILHDKIAAIDYTYDIEVLAHELAHQWFGNLVTCRDWSNIWLNEGFATYSEALYYESSKGYDEFCYRFMKIIDEYLKETRNKYKRPIVTAIYKHPDEMLDAHSYQKGACVLHMLRNYMGDDCFRTALKTYLNKFRNKTAETEDLCKIAEDVSRKNMRQFFDQWVNRSGHPIIDIEFSLEQLSRKVNVKITQLQNENHHDGNGSNTHTRSQDYNHSDLFEFDLDLKLYYSTTDTDNNQVETIRISKMVTTHSIVIPTYANIQWISIDPQCKILKEIKSMKIVNETKGFELKEMLKNQLRNGKSVIERIESARALKDRYSEDVVNELYHAVISDPFYGVSTEAANTLGSYYDKDNYAKTSYTYKVLISCLNRKENIFSQLHPDVRRAIARNIGQFERGESIDLLEPILYRQNESYFVREAIAASIGKSAKNMASLDNTRKENIISQLKEIIEASESFQNVIASGAIDGLKEFSKDKNKDIVADIANNLVRNTDPKNDFHKRLAATSALSKFLSLGMKDDDNNGNNLELLKEINQQVFSCLCGLLKDKRRKIKINACKAFTDKDAKPLKINCKWLEAIEVLIQVAETDLDGLVRREAEWCANILKDWIKEWSTKPPVINLKLREYS